MSKGKQTSLDLEKELLMLTKQEMDMQRAGVRSIIKKLGDSHTVQNNPVNGRK